MPKVTHTVTAKSGSIWARISGRGAETVAVYGQDDLRRRLSEARQAGVKVTVRENRSK